MFAVSISIPTNIPALVRAVESDIDKWEQELAYRIPDEARRLMELTQPMDRALDTLESIYRGVLTGRG